LRRFWGCQKAETQTILIFKIYRRSFSSPVIPSYLDKILTPVLQVLLTTFYDSIVLVSYILESSRHLGFNTTSELRVYDIINRKGKKKKKRKRNPIRLRNTLTRSTVTTSTRHEKLKIATHLVLTAQLLSLHPTVSLRI
jgi:hypothetical protein